MPDAETFAGTLDRLYREQFTGSIVVLFGQGVPSVIEIPCEPTRIRLAKRPRSRVELTATP